MKKELKTKRLTLRPVQLGDEKEIHEYAGEFTCLITREEWKKNQELKND